MVRTRTGDLRRVPGVHKHHVILVQKLERLGGADVGGAQRWSRTEEATAEGRHDAHRGRCTRRRRGRGAKVLQQGDADTSDGS